MMDILIKDAVVLTMQGGSVVRGYVGINGGSIAYLGADAPNCPVRRTIDAKGRIVMPGLVNAHAHTAMCVMRGYADDYALEEWLYKKVFPVEARLNEAAIVAGVRLGMAEMIATGTTSFSDMYFYQPAVAEAVIEAGMRANLCNAIIALGDDYSFEDDRAVIETRRLIADYHNAAGGRIRADVSIHAEYTSSPHIWERVHALAAEHGLITHVHVSETRAEHEGSIARHGLTPTMALARYGVFDTPVLAAHGVWLSEEDMELMAARRASVAHCPVSNLKLGSGIADVCGMLAHGVNVCLGTDGVCSNNSLDLFEELKLAALLAKGSRLDPTAVTAQQALELATVRGAIAQGRQGQTGIIAPGYDADIIMLASDSVSMQPLYNEMGGVVYSASGHDVVMTMVQGRILYENGEWTTIDVERAVNDVKRLAVPLVVQGS